MTTSTPPVSRAIGAPGDLIAGIEFVGSHARQTRDPNTPRGGIVESVAPGSPAAAVGIVPGQMILSINGARLRDVVDYQFQAADAVLELELASPHETADGVRWARRHVTILKDAGEPLGLTFTQPTFTPIRECNNHCPFCFIDQLPGSMRSSLYIRDDDYRYSFLFGNFVTLTNLNERDWQRLAEQRLSPLYVSVHATDLAMRRLLLGNDRAPDIRDQLARLFALGIRVHTQVVTCPSMNDGAVLEETVADLAAHYPNVLSIGVVPVGLTRTPAEILSGPGASCSRILPSAADLPLRAFEPDEARALVAQVRAWQRRYRRQYDCSLVYASDEFYLLADRPVPSARAYDGYPQYENGIGMVRDLLDDWARTKRRIMRSKFPVQRSTFNGERSTSGSSARDTTDTCRDAIDRVSTVSPNTTIPAGQRSSGRQYAVTLVCGEMIAPVLGPMVEEWTGLTGTEPELVVIRNAFFGPRVRVSGLLTGGDIVANADRFHGDVVILPEVMLDKTGSRLLDNMTPAALSARLDRPVHFAGTMSRVNELIRGDRESVR